MRFETWESKARGATEAWRKQYVNTQYQTIENLAIYKKLIALKDPTKEQVDATIGNCTWTSCQCDLCARDMGAVVIFDVRLERGNILEMCIDCLRSALLLTTRMEGDLAEANTLLETSRQLLSEAFGILMIESSKAEAKHE